MLGSSHPVYDQNLISIIKKINPSSILDLGCGKGKLGSIIKDTKTRQSLNNTLNLVGVNPLFDKVSDYNLLTSVGYDEIIDLSIDNYL